MIEPDAQSELSEQEIAQKVRDSLANRCPGGVTLHVDPQGVHRGEFGWRVRVLPDREPIDLIEYYEGLVDIEMELEEREQLNVWLVTADPTHLPPAETPEISGATAAPTRLPGKLKRPRGTQQLVAQKVAEYLRDCHPGGTTLEVDADHIRKEQYWWEVPVRPAMEPRKRSEYYEALADVERALDQREHLRVFLLPGDAKLPEEASS